MELVTVKVTPQNTADVYIGELHIKTFGGTLAHQAACDFAQQIKNEIAAHNTSVNALGIEASGGVTGTLADKLEEPNERAFIRFKNNPKRE